MADAWVAAFEARVCRLVSIVVATVMKVVTRPALTPTQSPFV